MDADLPPDRMEAHYRSIIRDLDAIHPPLRVTLQDTIVLNYVHYGESPLITRLRWLPAVELGVAAIFILMGYIGFSYIKRNEQSNIWVGMAKETAHQLGTPLSSLMGWLEMMKSTAKDHPEQLSIIAEMENDLDRFRKSPTASQDRVTARAQGGKPEEVIAECSTTFSSASSRFAKNRKISLSVNVEGNHGAHQPRTLRMGDRGRN